MDDVKDILSNLEEHKTSNEEESRNFENLQTIMKKMDLSVLNPEPKCSTLGTKKRKTQHCPQKAASKLALEKELEDTAQQIHLVKRALSQIYEIQDNRFTKMISKREDNDRGDLSTRTLIDHIIQRGKRIPLWLGRSEDIAPPLCGCLEADADYKAQIGDLVAALVEQNEKKNWILTEVIAYDPETEKYTVDDIFESNKAEHIIIKDDLIPLPSMRANPETCPEALFAKQSVVLALYPQTTCFYRGVIYEVPHHPTEPYQIMFEDGRYECNFSPPVPIDQCYVLNNRNTSEAVQKKCNRMHSRDATDTTESEDDSSVL